MSLSKLTANLAILLDSTVDNVDSYLNGTTAGDAVDSVVEGGAAAEPTLLTTLVSFLPFILIIVCFYFFLIRPQRKQEKETQKMRNSIEIGDQITTIGGITGVVRQIKDEDTYIIETGADKNRISIKKWAIQSKDTISDS
jgi:preprotein translocase subunit YajC